MKINADGFKKFGTTEQMFCSKCNNLVNMDVFKSSSGLGVFGISLFNYQTELFTICPTCGALYAVNKDVSNAAGKDKSNKVNTISEAHLTYLKDLKING